MLASCHQPTEDSNSELQLRIKPRPHPLCKAGQPRLRSILSGTNTCALAGGGENGAKSAKLLYELIVAEMDVAVARFYVTLNTGIVTKEQG
jgi:hypothetical protein